MVAPSLSRASELSPKDCAQRIVDSMAQAGIRFACVLPESLLVDLYSVLKGDERFTVIPVAKEEEGIGIMTGTFFAGVPGALLMSNSGFLTCSCALNGLAIRSGIPMLMMIVQRGELGEPHVLQGHIALPTIGVLEALGIRHFTFDDIEHVDIIRQSLDLAYVMREPVALLMTQKALLGPTASASWLRGSEAERKARAS